MRTENPTTALELLERKRKSIAKNAARESKHLDAMTHGAQSLPDGFSRVLNLSPHTSTASAFVEIAAATRWDAAAMLAELPPIPIWVIRDGARQKSINIRPATNPGRISSRAEVHYEILPCYWHYEPNLYHPSHNNACLNWWTQRDDGGLLEVRCWIKQDPARLVEDHDRNDRGWIIRHRWILRNDVNGEQINYSSSDSTRPGKRLRYFFAEPGNGPGLAHYLMGGITARPDWSKVPDVRDIWTTWEPKIEGRNL